MGGEKKNIFFQMSHKTNILKVKAQFFCLDNESFGYQVKK